MPSRYHHTTYKCHPDASRLSSLQQMDDASTFVNVPATSSSKCMHMRACVCIMHMSMCVSVHLSCASECAHIPRGTANNIRQPASMLVLAFVCEGSSVCSVVPASTLPQYELNAGKGQHGQSNVDEIIFSPNVSRLFLSLVL